MPLNYKKQNVLYFLHLFHYYFLSPLSLFTYLFIYLSISFSHLLFICFLHFHFPYYDLS